MKNEIRLIDQITAYFGSAYRASKAIGVSPQQYHHWKIKGKIPFNKGKIIEAATNGEFKAIQVWEDASL
jgi:DNA-binding transcriptional regulator YdaS (Cro superfamily)